MRVEHERLVLHEQPQIRLLPAQVHAVDCVCLDAAEDVRVYGGELGEDRYERLDGHVAVAEELERAGWDDRQRYSQVMMEG